MNVSKSDENFLNFSAYFLWYYNLQVLQIANKSNCFYVNNLWTIRKGFLFFGFYLTHCLIIVTTKT